MKRKTAFLVGLLTLAACSDPATEQPAPAAAPPASDATVFENARVIVGDGSVIENGSFVVADGRFAEVGQTGAIDAPEGATRVDLSGMTVMPAMVDTHVHLSTERDPLIQDLRRRAYFGVGAALSLGADGTQAPLEVRGETIPGAARYRTAGRGITAPEPGRSEVPHWVTTVEEARAAVREEAERGVDIIKVWVDDRNGMYEKLTPELYGAVIDEAHANDLRVTAHIFHLEDAKGLLRAGVDAFAHSVRDVDIDDEGLALFRERPGFVLIPNLPDRGVATDLSWLAGTVAAEQLQELQARATDRPEVQQRFAVQGRNLAKLDDAGVRIAMGTDGSVPWAAHLEMEDMVAAGMTPAEVIVAATRNSAELLRLDDVGTVATGMSADFVVLDANPLDDITNTRRIDAVYLRGTAMHRDSVSARLIARPGA